MAVRFMPSKLLALLCAGGLFPSVAFSQAPVEKNLENDLMALLNTPITTATRTSQSSAKAPATVVTVTAE